MSRSRPIIGVDLNGRSIRAAQLAPRPGARPLAAATSLRRHGADHFDATDAARLEAVLDRQGFRGRDIAVAVPRRLLLSAALEVTGTATGAEIEQAARRELAGMGGCAPHEMELAWWTVPTPARGGEGRHIIAAACPHRDAATLLDTLEDAGLSVAVLDLESAALVRASAEPGSAPNTLRCVLAVDHSSTHLALALDEVVIFQRTLPSMGLEEVVQELSRQFGLDAEGVESLLAAGDLEDGAGAEPADGVPPSWFDAVHRALDRLVNEVKSSVSYVQQRYPQTPLSRVTLTGEGASIPLLIAALSAQLPSNVEPFVPAGDRRGHSRWLAAHPGELATAVGLALREE